jgi:hypothetical protein
MRKIILLALLVISTAVSYAQTYSTCYRADRDVKYSGEKDFTNVTTITDKSFTVEFNGAKVIFYANTEHYIETYGRSKTYKNEKYNGETTIWSAYSSALGQMVEFSMITSKNTPDVILLCIDYTRNGRNERLYYFTK